MLTEMWDRNSRIVIVAAHPDDETIGMGGQLASLENVMLIQATDGAPRRRADWRQYARARRGELLCAASLAAIAPERCIEIGLPDQEAAYHLVELSCHLSRLFREIRPEIIFTHPYEGGHPDHDATAFAVHQAASAPIVEFTSYHRGASGGIETGCFLGPAGEVFRLSGRQKSMKQRMLDCFSTQCETLRWFHVDQERFRRAPEYDFCRPPHPGPVFYESFDWGCNFIEWQRQARRAEERIGTCLSR
jgi:LmbE family N-acetylglucosaminyl deacetylase